MTYIYNLRRIEINSINTDYYLLHDKNKINIFIYCTLKTFHRYLRQMYRQNRRLNGYGQNYTYIHILRNTEVDNIGI